MIKRRKRWTNELLYLKELSMWQEKLSNGRIHYESLISLRSAPSTMRLNTLYEKVKTQAMEVTKAIVEAQNKERSLYLHTIKKASTEQYSARNNWNSLINSLTHERAVWFEEKTFPRSWQLDTTEGPSRIRRRLKRCHLAIPEKFFLEETKSRSTTALPLGPLAYLFEKSVFETDSTVLINHIHTNERIVHITPCSIITPKEECKGELLIGASCIHFVGQHQQSLENDSKTVVKELWLFEDIKELEERRYQLQNIALEIFLGNGTSYLLAFRSNSEREEFRSALLARDLPNLIQSNNITSVTKMWRERAITNFDYLMFLNKASGRSFNDLMQYPVFPYILSDYENDVIDLNNVNSYRDLSRPMAIQQKSREKDYIDQYNYLKKECSLAASREFFMPVMAPFHYGSHYSNSGTVLHFLVRIPPFTQLFLQYQDNNFDIPDRTFHSMSTAWKLASGGSSTDFKELIPEFFFLPEFLQNNEHFNFGLRHNGIRVEDVNLPNWCRGDARLFVLINRQALESKIVTDHLNQWIDLVFGYKQSGKAAEDAINVFHPATYYGVEVDAVEDPLKRSALETMIRTYGQMPMQLFTLPHPSSNTISRNGSEVSVMVP